MARHSVASARYGDLPAVPEKKWHVRGIPHVAELVKIEDLETWKRKHGLKPHKWNRRPRCWPPAVWYVRATDETAD